MTVAQPSDRLCRLLNYLKHDPKNATLATDAAAEALEGDQPQLVRQITDAFVDPPASLLNLKALALLSQGRTEEAVALLKQLCNTDGTLQLRANLAAALSLQDRHSEAIELLDEDTVFAASKAAFTAVTALHSLGRLEEALARGALWLAATPEDKALQGVLSIVALDAGEIDVARRYADGAAQTPEALSTLGLLYMTDDDIDHARKAFDQALALRPDSARALMGRGLLRLESGAADEAARNLDAAAELFKHHLGSWIAAGWAYLIAGDLEAARGRFQRAVEIDDTFAEGHGGLAVTSILSGNLAAGGREAAVARRLDKSGLGSALAAVLILEHKGDAAGAERVRQLAMKTPIGPSGQTLLQLLLPKTRSAAGN